MKNFKKLLSVALFSMSFLLFLSCSQDENASREKNFVTLKFGSVSEKSNSLDSNVVVIEAEVITTESGSIEFVSDNLIKMESVNIETGELGYTYTLKNENLEKEIIEKWGLFYGGGDCAIYGKYTYDTLTMKATFTPASRTTQLLLNVCGLSNLC